MEQKTRSSFGIFCQPIPLSLLCSLSLLAGCTTSPEQIGASPTPITSPSPSPSLLPSPFPTATSPTLSSTPSPSPTTSPSPTVGKPAEVVTIENQVRNLVTKAGEITIQDVNCPANLSERSQSSYDCQVLSNIGSFVVVVQPTGQTGEFRWSTKGLLLVSKLAPLIERNFSSPGSGKVSVDCGAIARTAKAGETFDCKITDASGTAKTARVTVRDELGNVYVTPL